MTTTPTRRIWDLGDPEPVDCDRVLDADGDVWLRHAPDAWRQPDVGPEYVMQWKTITRFGPLAEDVEGTIARLAGVRDGETVVDAVKRVVDERNDARVGFQLALERIAEHGRLASARDGETVDGAIKRLADERDDACAGLRRASAAAADLVQLTGARQGETVPEAVSRIITERDQARARAESAERAAETLRRTAFEERRSAGRAAEQLLARAVAAEKLAEDRRNELDQVSEILTQLRAELQRRGMGASS